MSGSGNVVRAVVGAVLRVVLAGCLLAVSAVVSGCGGGGGRTLVVLGPWTGGEEKPFLKVLDAVGERTGHRYVYQGTRSLRETLVAQLQAGAPPDVAVLNNLGDLVEYARDGAARPLPEGVAGSAVKPWAPRVQVTDGSGTTRENAYWVPVRIDLKSLVWSRSPPTTSPSLWCLGMASEATSGWPGTDWIEDLLLQRRGAQVYQDWATGRLAWSGPEVRGAWQEWADLLTPESAADALSTSFEDIGGGRYGLLNRGTACAQEHQGSFIRRHYGNEVLPYPTALFVHGRAARQTAFEVSGDMAAVFKESDDAWRLVRELTSEEARRDWVAAARPQEQPLFPGGSIAGTRPPTPGTRTVQALLDGADRICFDASDAMPPTLRDAFSRAVLEFLAAPHDSANLTRLLKQLDKESEFQHEDGAFQLDDLCDRPHAGGAGG
ncbi:ABC transporter substrate-binding protein [Streptomyces sp. NPDC058200]|uniref:ABC transporter substrate-binding protein n=1 Tax=Streptomyces sp. NPDC058200 TaxID=3346378 RepID=UPI0036E9226C